MRILLALLSTIVLIPSGAARPADLALTGAKIYTSPMDPPIENGSIVIRDGQIVSLGPASTIKIPHSATVIDCKGLVVTAGFWNSHVHILAPTLLHIQDTDAKSLNQALDATFNRWGFTTVYDIFGAGQHSGAPPPHRKRRTPRSAHSHGWRAHLGD